MWKNKIKEKTKRILATWLSICMVFQILAGYLAPLSIYAGEDTSELIEIEIRESMIRNKLQEGLPITEWEDINLRIPYSGAKRAAAQELLLEKLTFMTLVKKEVRPGYAYVIAARGDDPGDLDTPIDEVVFIGLNASAVKDITFRLKIVDESGMVIRTLTTVSYGWDNGKEDDDDTASRSDASLATESDATESNATESGATESDAETEDMAIAAATPSGISEDDRKATDSDAEETASGSDISSADKNEDGMFLELDRKTLSDEDGIAGIVVANFWARVLSFEDKDDFDEDCGAVAPKGGAAMIQAAGDDAGSDEVGTLARVEVRASEESVNTGKENVFYLTAEYSNIVKNGAGYFAIEFDVTGLPENAARTEYLIGPETKWDADEQTGDIADDWAELKGYLKANGLYEDGQAWSYAPQESYRFFYCKDTGVGAFKLGAAGSSIQQLPIKFQFKNGITPDGVEIHASSFVLNENEIAEQFANLKVSESGPGANWEEIKENALKNGFVTGEATISNHASFQWKGPVKKVEKPDTLGVLWNFYKNGSAGDINYKITAGPEYGGDTTSGNIWTQKVVVRDTLSLEGMTFRKNLTISSSSDGGYHQIFLNGLRTIWFTVNTGAGKFSDFSVDFIMNEEGEKTGIQWQYVITNADSPKGDVQLNNGNVLEVPYNFYGTFGNKDGLYNLIEGTTPRITNKVEIEAQSVLYDKVPDEQKTEHIYTASSEAALSGTEAFPITKTAYTAKEDGTIGEKATGAGAVFEPESYVYYQIEAVNKGYSDKEFVFRDRLPEGLESGAELTGLTVGGVRLDAGSYPPNVNGDYTEWGSIGIPAGKSAVLTVKARIKDADAFKNSENQLDTRLVNVVDWYKADNMKKSLGSASATIFVNVETLTEGALVLEKTSDKEKNPNYHMGDTITYTLTAKPGQDKKYAQTVKLTDYWPGSQVTFTQVQNLPPNGLIILKDAEDKILASYHNGTTGNVTKSITDFQKPAGVIRPNIAKIEIYVHMAEGKSVSVGLQGNVNSDGSITNTVTGPGGAEASSTVHSTSMAISKTAHRIAGADAGSITEDTAVNQDTCDVSDVILYKIQIGNDLGSSVISPVISDNLAEIKTKVTKELMYQNGIVSYAEAVLGGKKGSIFYRISDGEGRTSGWRAIEAPSDGMLRYDMAANNEIIEPKGTIEFWIYLKVPANAVTNSTRNYVNTATASLNLNGSDFTVSASATISTLSKKEQAVSITKEIHAVGSSFDKATGVMDGANWYTEKYLRGNNKNYQGFIELKGNSKPAVTQGDYVFYLIEIKNEGETALDIFEIEDKLPDGMQFEAIYQIPRRSDIYTEISGDNKLTFRKDNIRNLSSISGDNGNVLLNFTNQNTDSKVHVGIKKGKATVDGQWFRARTYASTQLDESSGIATIDKGRTVMYGIVAKVTGPVTEEEILTNYTGAVVRRSAVVPDGRDCAVQNIDWLEGAEPSGQITYDDVNYKVVVAEAAVTGAQYAPGIEKKVYQYQYGQQWKDWPESPDTILPTYPLRWMVTLHNGTYGTKTAGAIEEYEVRDILPAGMAYNADDPAKFINSAGKSVALPNPEMVTEDGVTTVGWTIKRLDSQAAPTYQITGAKEDEAVTTDVNLAIPVQGTLRLQVGTVPGTKDKTSRYGTFVNQADLIPASNYPFNDKAVGEMIKDEDETYVQAKAEISLYGAGKTSAYKEVTTGYQHGKNEASGKENNDYAYALAGQEVTYTLRITNEVDSSLENLVLIDRLPAPGDHGLVNSIPRQSKFPVQFAEDPGVKVELVQGGSKIPVDDELYDLRYASWQNLSGGKGVYILTEEQWSADSVRGWEENPDGKDTLGIVFSQELLNQAGNGTEIIVTFKARLPEADAVENLKDAIAWNSFGYSYEVNKSKLTVEPVRVGVKIPTAELLVSKTVESPFAADKEREFTFQLAASADGTDYQPVPGAQYTVSGKYQTETEEQTAGKDGKFQLKDGQTAEFTVMADYHYRVTELDAEGFRVSVTDFKAGKDTLFGEAVPFDKEHMPAASTDGAVSAGSSHSVTFRNEKILVVLPETGGGGIGRLYGMGAMMMAVALMFILISSLSAAGGACKKKEKIR